MMQRKPQPMEDGDWSAASPAADLSKIDNAKSSNIKVDGKNTQGSISWENSY